MAYVLWIIGAAFGWSEGRSMPVQFCGGQKPQFYLEETHFGREHTLLAR